MRKLNKSGFSLVELSIVLTIIGLLVATVTVGKDLIERATLNKIIKQIDEFKVAASTFRNKYGYLPGDFPDATQFWGTATNCLDAQADGTTLTCNGDGDGYISYPLAAAYEAGHFMRQLGNAGMITGAYNGQSAFYPDDKDSPRGAIKGSYWVAWSTINSSARVLQGRAINQNANRIVLGIPANRSNNAWYGASLSAADQYYIDKKIDDGLPYQGKVVDMSGTHVAFTANCASINSAEFNNTPAGTTSINAVYLVERAGPSGPNNNEGCTLIVDLE